MSRKRLHTPPEEDHYRRLAREVESLRLPPLLCPRRLSQLLDMDRRRVYELLQTGELDSVRVGPRSRRVPRENLLRWLAAGGYGSRARQSDE